MHLALSNEHLDICKFLIKNNATVDALDDLDDLEMGFGFNQALLYAIRKSISRLRDTQQPLTSRLGLLNMFCSPGVLEASSRGDILHMLEEDLQAELRGERKLKSRLDILKESGAIGEEGVRWVDKVLRRRIPEEGSDTIRVPFFD